MLSQPVPAPSRTTVVFRAGLAGLLLVTLPLALVDSAAFTRPLRRLTTAMTAPLLNASGQDVRSAGTELRSRDGTYEVDDECSGVRKLWAAVLLALALATMRRLNACRTAGLALVAGAAELAGNVLRVGTLYYLEIVLRSTSELLHHAAGVTAFALVVAAILGASAALTPSRE